MVKSMSDDLCAFWQEVERQRTRKNERRLSLNGIAKRLNVPVGTLISWRKRGQMNSYFLKELLRILHWPLAEDDPIITMGVHLFYNEPSQRKTGLHEFVDKLRKAGDAYVADCLPKLKRYSGHSQEAVNALGEHCIFVYTSVSVTPHEFEDASYSGRTSAGGAHQEEEQGREIGHAIARALLNGAHCLYIRPDRERVAYYEKWNMQELISYERSVEQIGHFRARLRKWFADGTFGYPLGESEIETLLYGRLQQCYVNDSPIWMPGVGLSMVGMLYDRKLITRMAISLPGGEFGGVLLYPHYPLFEQRFGEFVGKVVSDACVAANEAKKSHPKRIKNIIINQSHAELTASFYTAFDQLIRAHARTDPAEK